MNTETGNDPKQPHTDRDPSDSGEHEGINTLHESADGVRFGISAQLRDTVEEALDRHEARLVLEYLAPLHAADIADLINHLKARYREPFFQLIKDDLDPETLVDVDPALQLELIKLLSIKQIAQAVLHLDSDDAISLLEMLDEELIHAILQKIPAGERSTLERVLRYPEKSAGRLMQREIVCVPAHWSLKEVSDYIKGNQEELPSFFYDIFVVDPRYHLLGKIPLNQLLRHETSTLVSDIMLTDTHAFPDTSDQEEVAQAFKHYALVSAPIISSSGRVIGMVTVDDVVDVVEEEAEEDMLHMHKVRGESDFYAPASTTAYWRTRWLLITLVNTLIASYVISKFEASIQQITALSFLMTINAAMGGNSGMQVVTVVVRALATRSLLEEDTWRAVRKELGVSLMTGGFCALILGGIAGLWIDNMGLGIILTVSLMCNMLWASFAGTLFPIIISRFGLDPAISAGPILTTTTDVLGYALFLGLATLFLI
ncbi:MAG: magnesium transporter [Alphaproteobacteria bacterium]|nr:magnesium transporter [Alphaproteobacteria bacterium]NCQ66309.1 magnesium transporter [Alphaproteobacteria bacterium]NCT06795.1 magnesium transporter [Alphaproteobacteria bacterium]